MLTAAVLALGALAMWRLVGRGNDSVLDPNVVAVAPFDVHDVDSIWREGLADILARNLDGAGLLRTVPPTTVVRRWSGRADSAVLERARVIERLGQRDQALRDYLFVARAWRAADPELHNYVLEATQAIERLGGRLDAPQSRTISRPRE